MFNPRRSTRLASAAATTPPAAAPPAAAAAAAAAAPPAANESSNGEGVKKRIKTSASAAIKPKSFFRPNKSKGDQPKLAYDKRPTNIATKEKQKKAGKLWGYSVLKPGRPSKTVVTEKAVEAEDVVYRKKRKQRSMRGFFLVVEKMLNIVVKCGYWA